VIRALTKREQEVAVRLACGETGRDIAAALGISIKTVSTHRGHLLVKLGLRHNVDLARRAIQEGVVSSTDPAIEVRP